MVAPESQRQSSELLTYGLSRERESAFELYGKEARLPELFAANCLRARRLVERFVRFVPLDHRDWDQQYDLPSDLRLQCGDVDQACAALVRHLQQRGLLDPPQRTGRLGWRVRPRGLLPRQADAGEIESGLDQSPD